MKLHPYELLRHCSCEALRSINAKHTTPCPKAQVKVARAGAWKGCLAAVHLGLFPLGMGVVSCYPRGAAGGISRPWHLPPLVANLLVVQGQESGALGGRMQALGLSFASAYER